MERSEILKDWDNISEEVDEEIKNGTIEWSKRKVEENKTVIYFKDRKLPFYFYTENIRYFRVMSSLHNIVKKVVDAFNYYVLLSDIPKYPKLLSIPFGEVKIGQEFRYGGVWYIKINEGVYNARIVNGRFVTQIPAGRNILIKK